MRESLRKVSPLKNMFRCSVLIGLTFLFTGCAGLIVEPEPQSISPAPQAAVPNLQSYDSLHFSVQAQSLGRAQEVSDIAERSYKKIMFDMNLMSFKPKENYPIILYRSHEDYQRQSGLPAWSSGGSMTVPLGQLLPNERDNKALTRIVTYEAVFSAPLLSHEITHLVFNEYMAFFTGEEMKRLRWLNEGLATFQEAEVSSEALSPEYIRLTRALVREHRLTFENLFKYDPFNGAAVDLGSYSWAGRQYLYRNIDIWYWQTREIVSFLIRSQSPYNFYLFLTALKNRKSLEGAIADAYPGKWRSLADLESEWIQSLR